MTWRYFFSRLMSLSAKSRWVGALVADERPSGGGGERVVRIEDPAAIESFVAGLASG